MFFISMAQPVFRLASLITVDRVVAVTQRLLHFISCDGHPSIQW
jgi:hypothetical protein